MAQVLLWFQLVSTKTCVKRTANIDNEQVSAKSKPVRGFCLLKRIDAPEAMKEDGRNEGRPDAIYRLIPPQREKKGHRSSSSSASSIPLHGETLGTTDTSVETSRRSID